MTRTTDPREVLATQSMKPMQWLIVAMMVLLTALDGFNVQSISFAAPGISRSWGIEKAALGVVLSSELAGMAIGSLMIGRIADRFGRRPVILGGLVIMGLGMGLCSSAGSVGMLTAWRVLTGVGVGGMLAVGNATVAEFCHASKRPLGSALMAGGFPLGAVLGGLISTSLLAGGSDWHSVFLVGCIGSILMIPVAFWLIPESPSYVVGKGGPQALGRVNKILARLGQPQVEALAGESAEKVTLKSVATPALLLSTALLTATYFFHSVTFYFFVKWIPKFVVGFGLATTQASKVLVWCNVGGVLGSIALSLLTLKLRPIRLVISMLLASVVGVSMLAFISSGPHTLLFLTLLAFIVGFVMNAAIVGSYGLMALTFPTAVRASGTGLVIGIGRIGSVIGPILAGVLLQSGLGLGGVALLMALGSLVGALAAVLLARRI
ncbi:MAG: MFS transporter [Propionibacteriaceae bacterium]